MLFGVAMPSLYFAGMVFCFSMYWLNKIFFLRIYKIPVKFGVKQALNVVNLLEWASWVHMLFGMYMMSSPHTFKTKSTAYDDSIFAV